MKEYGLLSETGEKLEGQVPELASRTTYGELNYTIEWSRHIIPTEDQGRLGSCVGHATANYVEAMIRKYAGADTFSQGEQIDAEAIYHTARDMFWKGQGGEGLYINQGFYAAKQLGIIPPEASIELIPADLKELSGRLSRSPIVCGQIIHNAWYNAQGNGNIPDGHTRMGGHAVLLFGITANSHGQFALILNSWGKTWGWHGIGILPLGMLVRDSMHNGYAGCYATAQSWTEWDGWRKYIKKA